MSLTKENLIIIKEKLISTKQDLIKDMDQMLGEVKAISANRNVLDEGDEANNMNTRFRYSIILDKQADRLKKVSYSLLKINQKNFGICEMCGDTINYERLLARPHAKYCIACKSDIEKKYN